jgi:hypothetical protein
MWAKTMSGSDFTMITEQERKEVTEAAHSFYECLKPMEYMTPYSYRDLFRDEKTKEVFVLLADLLMYVKKTYVDGSVLK